MHRLDVTKLSMSKLRIRNNCLSGCPFSNSHGDITRSLTMQERLVTTWQSKHFRMCFCGFSSGQSHSQCQVVHFFPCPAWWGSERPERVQGTESCAVWDGDGSKPMILPTRGWKCTTTCYFITATLAKLFQGGVTYQNNFSEIILDFMRGPYTSDIGQTMQK